MRIAVVGAGAVGCYFGARLAQAGSGVAFLARGATLEALTKTGLRIESSEGGFELVSVEATDSAAAIGPVDLVLVAVKAWQVPEVARQIAPLVGERTVVLPLENGVEAADQLAAEWGPRVLGGTCKIVAVRVAPGHVRHVAVRPTVALGELDRSSGERVAAIAATFRAAGIDVETPDDIQVSIWEKLLFIAPTSGVGALTRAPLGVVREIPETRELLVRAMREVRAVAAARGVGLRADIVERVMAFLDGMPRESTTSTQRDLIEGRPSELEALNGAVMRLGQRAGVATPVNEFVYAGLLPWELRARGTSSC